MLKITKVSCLAVLPALCCVAMFVGCGDSGPRNCSISGKVTVDGKLVQEGSITFEILEEGDLPSGAMIIDGFYETETTPGRKRVRISAPDLDTGMIGEEEEGGMYGELIPSKYADSPPEIDVQGNGTHDFELTSQ